ncbi:MAG: hypothetical protein MJB14_23740 [Spirochaetes bacterium]|nr:hypothetical protein [Spirochaetota bacterium]
MKKVYLIICILIITISFSLVATSNDTTSDSDIDYGYVLIFFGLTIAIVAGVVFYQVNLTKKRKKIIEDKIKEYPEFENEIRTKYKQSKAISTDMPYDLVEFILGKPGDTQESFNGKIMKLKCFYGAFRNSRGNINFSWRVDFEGTNRNDLKVKGWKQLK